MRNVRPVLIALIGALVAAGCVGTDAPEPASTPVADDVAVVTPEESTELIGPVLGPDPVAVPDPVVDSAPPVDNTTTPAPASDTVTVVEYRFEPKVLSIEPGTTVTFTNFGESFHTITSEDGSFNSAGLRPGESFTHTFTEAGIWAYFDSLYPAAKASIRVGMPAEPTAAPPASTPSDPTTPVAPVASTPTSFFDRGSHDMTSPGRDGFFPDDIFR